MKGPECPPSKKREGPTLSPLNTLDHGCPTLHAANARMGQPRLAPKNGAKLGHPSFDVQDFLFPFNRTRLYLSAIIPFE